MHDNAGLRNAGKAVGVVRAGPDRFGDIATHFVCVHVEGRGYLNVAHMIAADIGVHEAGDRLV